jgi:hypothetical protein
VTGRLRRPSAVLAALLAASLTLLCGCGAAPRAPEGKGRLPIRATAAKEAWEGVVTVRGSVVVPRGAVLRILPGTVVRFERIDADGDGIGDSELVVEGTLLAEGTAAAPIRFTSAEAEPGAADWKYLFIERSAGSRLVRCVSEYAYSGAQVHFCRIDVERCTFRSCVDGFRFSTADGSVSRCLMTGNVNGVRYEERGSRMELSGNEVTANRVGVFCVTEGAGSALFRGNRIHGNGDYDFKLGNRQGADVPVPGNWWGSADAAAIRARIFDRASDPSLGRVLIEPFLEAPPPGGGEAGA